jgi:hypothetical protein
MMTREERLAESIAYGKAQLAKVQARRRAAERKALSARCLLAGKMVHEAGLLALNDADLAALMQALSPLLSLPNPVAVLESLVYGEAGAREQAHCQAKSRSHATCFLNENA